MCAVLPLYKIILERTDMTENHTVLAYQHALQHYTSKIKQLKARVPVTITNQAYQPQVRKIETAPTVISEKRLMNSLPKT